MTVKQRYLLSLLCAIAMLYYALPQMPFLGSSLEQYFAFAWICLAFIVIGGNLSAILFTNDETERKQMKKNNHVQQRRQREFQ
jgi:integral membrane sensor domain MASE1